MKIIIFLIVCNGFRSCLNPIFKVKTTIIEKINKTITNINFSINMTLKEYTKKTE